MILVAVVVGAGIGAPLRYLTAVLLARVRPGLFPWGTFAVNVAGSLVLGVVAGGVAAGWVGRVGAALVGVGFCGALTTFSSFGYETLRLAEEGDLFDAVVNTIGTLAAALASATAGWWLGMHLG